MAWRLAPTIAQLRSEVNGRWPMRDKTSDGTIGNQSHQQGTGDHNPDSRGVVCAMDFDEDLSGNTGAYPRFKSGQGARVFVDRLLALARAGKLPQLYYVIYERQIFSRTYGFRARSYSGSNAHDHHVHVSVYHPASLADRRAPWGIGAAPPAPPPPKPTGELTVTQINDVMAALTTIKNEQNTLEAKVNSLRQGLDGAIAILRNEAKEQTAGFDARLAELGTQISAVLRAIEDTPEPTPEP